MVRYFGIFLSNLLLILCLMAPASSAARPQANYTEPQQLPVFELHSGFWINLHHTLYYEGRQRKAFLSRDANTSKSTAPKSVLAGKGLTDVEQKAWDDADSTLLGAVDLLVLASRERNAFRCRPS